jgi:hypothetical protein
MMTETGAGTGASFSHIADRQNHYVVITKKETVLIMGT